VERSRRTLTSIGHFSLGCHFTHLYFTINCSTKFKKSTKAHTHTFTHTHVHFSNLWWQVFASRGLPAIAELLVMTVTTCVKFTVLVFCRLCYWVNFFSLYTFWVRSVQLVWCRSVRTLRHQLHRWFGLNLLPKCLSALVPHSGVRPYHLLPPTALAYATGFYCATLCIAHECCLSHRKSVCLSVCLSHSWTVPIGSTYMFMISFMYGSSIILIFWRQIPSLNSRSNISDACISKNVGFQH